MPLLPLNSKRISPPRTFTWRSRSVVNPNDPFSRAYSSLPIRTRQSVAFGRRTAIWTSLGIGSAILVHVIYALLGLGLLIRGSEFWFSVVKPSVAK